MRIPLLSALAAFIAGVFLAILYGPGLQGGFFFDDEPSILYADGIRLESLTTESLREALASGRSGPSGRPVAQLSFALNHYFSGFDPFAFKATNLAIHAACGLLVFWLALRLLKAGSSGSAVAHVGAGLPAIAPRRKYPWGAVANIAGKPAPTGGSVRAAVVLAILWLLHPLQLTPVLHVVQRMTSLSAFFLLAALLLHIGARERGGRAGWAGLLLAWGVLWPLSCFSKETGVLFPLFALAWELIVRRSARGGLDRFARAFAVLCGLTLAAGILYSLSPAGQWLWAGYAYRDFTLVERLLTEGRVLWFYLSLILLPRLEAFGLYHDDIAVSTGLFVPWTTLPAWVGLAGLAWLAWRARAKAPLVAFGIAWFLIGHGLESTVLPLEIVHEHRNYLPLFGILLAGIAGQMRLLERSGPPRVLGLALASAALIYLPFVTALRAHQFGDEIRRTQIEAQHHRGSARAQYEAGRALAGHAEAVRPETPAYSFARAHYERAGELDPAFKYGLLGLVHLYCKAGQEVEQAWIGELARRLRDTPFGPGDITVMHALKNMSISGELCLKRGEVERLFQAAQANTTAATYTRADLHSWLADYLVLHERDLPAAQVELDRALALAPYNPGNLLKQAQLAILRGRLVDARGMLDRVEKLPLKRSEKEMLSGLRRCLANNQTGTACVVK
ncbi:MAG: pilus assembly protein PilF [Rhodocyclales bacterium]|nr:pilus assembly protein PilF [Rhodocyclales bacterium]